LSRKSDETAFPMKHLLLTENQTEHQMGTRRFKLFAGCSSQRATGDSMPQKKMAEYAAQSRARRRALGMRSTEAVLHQREIAIHI
ncbi:hypothetical protein VSX63_25095, partial [Aurantimonas sp. C2-4-R8]|nr:hypothetical protein [Aurantimonas sp. C2-4-R8]